MSAHSNRDAFTADKTMFSKPKDEAFSEAHVGITNTENVEIPSAGVALNSFDSNAECRLEKYGSRSNIDDVRDQTKYMNLRQKYNRNTAMLEHSRPKREAARNMCRPLKQWLYSHRDLPYPSKADKLELAAKSKMTITQVSNWFANARRRLKNTVSSSAAVTWERRLKLYNRNVVGNQERLSISSDDAEDDEDRVKLLEDIDEYEDWCCEANSSNSIEPNSTSLGHLSVEEKDARATPSDQCTNLPGKFKQGILQRYLNDAYHVSFVEDDDRETARIRKMSGSVCSRDSEDMTSSSSRSSPIKDQHVDDSLHKTNVYRFRFDVGIDESENDDLHTKEMSAILILTQLAASRRNSLTTTCTLRQ